MGYFFNYLLKITVRSELVIPLMSFTHISFIIIELGRYTEKKLIVGEVKEKYN